MLVEMIAEDLGLDTGYLLMLAKTASYRYKEYEVPKATGGFRKIFHPARELKTAQRWIHENILAKIPVHPCAGAYRPKQGLKAHVERHRGARYLLRIDFVDFFPSLTDSDIRLHFRRIVEFLPPKWSPEDTEILVKFVCRKGALTIGAVTSPSLSNTLCYELDSRLYEYCERRRITYTRYADDLFFSTNARDLLSEAEEEVAETINSLEYPRNLQINSKKTRHSSKKGRMFVTGLVLTPDGKVSIGRERKRTIRAQVHQWSSLTKKTRRSLAGYLAYCSAVEPGFVESLYKKYGTERMNQIRRFTGFESEEEVPLTDERE